jgi:hypothetical protein
MGLFNKITKGMTGIDVDGMMKQVNTSVAGLTAGPDAEVLQFGRPAQAAILQVQPLGTTVSVGNGLVERVCVFVVKITMDDVAPYQAQVKQRVPEIHLGQLQTGSVVVAAKVHPQDPQRIILDFNAPLPTVRYTGGGDPTHTAAYVLATGDRAEAVIVSSQPLNMTNAEGVPLQAFELTVIPAGYGQEPYRAKIGHPVPPSALPLIFPGAKLPVRVLSTDPNRIAIDWASAGAR